MTLKTFNAVQFRVSIPEARIWGTGTVTKLYRGQCTIKLNLEEFNFEPVRLSYSFKKMLADRVVYRKSITNNDVFMDVPESDVWLIGDPTRDDIEIQPYPLNRFLMATIDSAPSDYYALESLSRVEQNATGARFEEVRYICPKCHKATIGRNWGGTLFAACSGEACRIDVMCHYRIAKKQKVEVPDRQQPQLFEVQL
jgi:RNA polymerase subunit RPABC4/transcription elongation factor Spt4